MTMAGDEPAVKPVPCRAKARPTKDTVGWALAQLLHGLPQAMLCKSLFLGARASRPPSAVLSPDDFIEPLDDLHDFLRCGMGKALPNAFNR